MCSSLRYSITFTDAKQEKKPSTRSYSSVVTSKPDEVYYGDCHSSECPIFCCDPFADLHNEDDILDKHDDPVQHVDMKRSGNNIKVEGFILLFLIFVYSLFFPSENK